MRFRWRLTAFLLAILSAAGGGASLKVGRRAVLQDASPAAAAANKAIGGLVNAAIAQGKIPGAVVVAGHNGKIVFEKAYGMRALVPVREPMTEDTIFDLASLTKVLITAPAVMQLVEQGRLQLDDPVAKYLPAFSSHGKREITIRQLLTHTSGLPPDLPLTGAWRGERKAIDLACDAALLSIPGKEFRYSDINFIVLGALVEKISGLPLDQYAEKFILGPLRIKETRFLPPAEWRDRIAPTEYAEDGRMMRGIVDDPTARRMGGVAGDAGLFGTAGDLAIYAQSLLDRLAGRPSRFPLTRQTLEEMVAPVRIEGESRTTLRGLGWDIDSAYSSPRGGLFPVGSFGHTGYTGTSLWIDPGSDSYVILLTNAVHPHGHTDLRSLRSNLSTSVAGLFAGLGRQGRVQTGIDVLEKDHFAELAFLARKHHGKLRLGLLTNQTGLDAYGRRTADVLAHEAPAVVPGLKLKVLFSPEHGINGTEDKEGISNSIDPATGLPVTSLYGSNEAARRPALNTLRNLDAVIIDLQDAGVRFYTYETVVLYFLEAAGQTGTEIIVLDRPNPINGTQMQGPLSDAGRESYVDPMPLPVRHGMTLGELAHYFNGEKKLGAALLVIRMRGWRRTEWFDATGLEWVNPSPNLHSLAASTLYPALGLLERTNVSVGRGTPTPFAFMGAPWIDGPSLTQFLSRRSIPGVRFEPVEFTPQAPYPFAGRLCHGVRILVTERDAADLPELGLEIASALRHLYGEQFDLLKMDSLLLNRTVLQALLNGEDPRRIAAEWQPALDAFAARRRGYLFY